MLKSEEGIITRTVKYGESSVILDILTSTQGIKSYIISGVRGKGSKNKSSMIRVLNLVKFEAYSRDDDKLSRIKEISYSYVYTSIPFDVIKASIATFLIEICRKAVGTGDDYEKVYNFIIKGLIHLDKTNEAIAHFHILFLINLAKHLGFEITDNYQIETPYFHLKEGSFQIDRIEHRLTLDEELSKYLHYYLSQSGYREIPRAARQAILLRVVDYYRYHIEDFGELKSLEVLMTLYEN